jgi:5-methylcytosine-specific restriction endonuclease McrA
MATSRTGTGRYKRNSAAIKKKAQAAGLFQCPGFRRTDGSFHRCGVDLDYLRPKQPNSAEVDHVEPVRYGGKDNLSNLRVICRACNNARNRKQPTKPVAGSLLSRRW